jgi:hypothetical protein
MDSRYQSGEFDFLEPIRILLKHILKYSLEVTIVYNSNSKQSQLTCGDIGKDYRVVSRGVV